jgi:serine/threonine protein phosphatase 1
MQKKRQIAISDIHGCLKSFQTLLEDKVQFTLADELYLLGDFIDRGKDSKGVIDYVLNLQNKGFTVFCLMGNHEDMMLGAKMHPEKRMMWRQHGGIETLDSYDCDLMGLYEHPHFKFYQNLDYYIETDKYIFVHAGLNFRIGNPLDDEYSMLWVRNWHHKIERFKVNNKIIVHGHTPIKPSKIEFYLDKLDDFGYLDIDAGCVFGHQLCAVDLTNRQLYFQDNVD